MLLKLLLFLHYQLYFLPKIAHVKHIVKVNQNVYKVLYSNSLLIKFSEKIVNIHFINNMIYNLPE